MKARIIFLSLIGIAVIVVVSIYVALPLSSSQEQKKIHIESGESIDVIASKLYHNGLIRHPAIMKIAAALFFPSYSYKAGEYSITSNESLFGIMRKLAIGSPKREVTIVIPEGWSLNDISDYLQNKKVLLKEDFLQASKKDWSSDYPFLSDIGTAQSVEGYLFPDTYRIYADATPDDIVRKMLTNFTKKIADEYWDTIRNNDMKFGDIMRLASIVEKEVKSDTDRAMVADIFLRRMKLGMPLQADSTVNYITGKKNPQSSLSDLSIDSPYNTYQVRGLPPSPICNPGRSSIHSVVFPQKNDYLYFLTTKEGKTIFSKTFEEHVRNKKKYLF